MQHGSPSSFLYDGLLIWRTTPSPLAPDYSQTLPNLHAFLYDELKIATDGFRSSNKIGEGGFGSVYKVAFLPSHFPLLKTFLTTSLLIYIHTSAYNFIS